MSNNGPAVLVADFDKSAIEWYRKALSRETKHPTELPA